ncbi:MAG TPA: hypothetical protein VFP59_11375 [Candidatus Angelobacter sp.]|nr:hypothetical protein [Candidatus Angelobacter sp.]
MRKGYGQFAYTYACMLDVLFSNADNVLPVSYSVDFRQQFGINVDVIETNQMQATDQLRKNTISGTMLAGRKQAVIAN